MVVSTSASDEELITIYETIKAGARAFLWAEYQVSHACLPPAFGGF